MPPINTRYSLYLACYGVGADNDSDNGFPQNTESYYLYSTGIVGCLGSCPVGSWLVSVSNSQPDPPAAIPEPGTMLLMGMGVSGMAWMHRKLKSAN